MYTEKTRRRYRHEHDGLILKKEKYKTNRRYLFNRWECHTHIGRNRDHQFWGSTRNAINGSVHPSETWRIDTNVDAHYTQLDEMVLLGLGWLHARVIPLKWHRSTAETIINPRLRVRLCAHRRNENNKRSEKQGTVVQALDCFICLASLSSTFPPTPTHSPAAEAILERATGI
jgi:hypothetical protein